MKADKVNLLRLKFANILSFKKEQEIFFTADTKYTHTHIQYIRREQAIGNELITPVTVFYGANASGKSNIIKVFKDILNPLLGKTNEKFSTRFYNPFLLDDISSSQPSLLEMDFSIDDFRYILSFNFDITGIISENLTEYQNERKNVIYKRKNNKLIKPNKEKITRFEYQLTNELLKNRPDLLALDILDTRGNAYIHKIFNALKQICNIRSNDRLLTLDDMNKLAEKLFFDDRLRKKVIDFIQFADLGITAIKIKEKNSFPSSPPLSISVSQDYEIIFEHKGYHNKKYELSIENESYGTSQFTRYLILFLPVLLNGGIFIFDELEEKLHPMLLAKLVEMFNHQDINIGGAQLIFTTHNTAILKSDILKRDEIWFVEKNEEGNSSVYPLTEFKGIREGLNFEKGYLEGRFGAIPYFGDVNELAKILSIKE